MPSKPSSRSTPHRAPAAKVTVLRAGAPRTWMVRHPDPVADARVWIVDERVQNWNAWPTWHDLKGLAHGSPGKLWPREVYDWVKQGVQPLVIPMSSVNHVFQDVWWKGVVWNDVRQAWLLGWEPLNSPDLAALWARSTLENRLLALEKTPALRARLGVGPSSDRFQTMLRATIEGVKADPNQPALLVGVLEVCAEEWSEPPVDGSGEDDDQNEGDGSMSEAPEPLGPPVDRTLDANGVPRARFSLKVITPSPSLVPLDDVSSSQVVDPTTTAWINLSDKMPDEPVDP